MDHRAGRGDLIASKAGGWDEKMQDEVRRWGAGEDFFAVIDLEVGTKISLEFRMMVGLILWMAGGPLVIFFI